MIAIREARDADTPGIIAIYLATYGEEYAYPQYYDEYEIKKLIFSDETLMLVAEDTETSQVVGTASVILEVGAYTDLVGEFGRLAVHPDYRRRGIGTGLLNRRIETVRDRVHVGVIEGRVTHPFTQAIAQQQGFAPVGFLPLKFVFGERRESMGFLVRLFGRALELRRNREHDVGVARRLVDVQVDGDHEVELVERLLEALCPVQPVGEGEPGVLGDGSPTRGGDLRPLIRRAALVIAVRSG